ncbi:diaminobutyrate--2-oxoglutarate transaminase [Geomicrobium sp. JCM 19039]|uniref:diaminobutyrate--2-oxoglutarate transaminase n=1 Tax=Geomicrobium sp. JCM 19039 TaxID=1460636 RepID=UPI00045F4BB3|nr:diaminobutyrate--2-oxoglutarate transaminase [Geomicrobium sp. JCM 19039]GAK13459.1 diaminobutyrate-pyruvate aminotransferase [Geomicrobium sp. JCM 19039]
MTTNTMNVFEELESEVRSYSRSFPTVFHKAKGYKLYNEDNKEYIDFFSGAGALNYGHNDDYMKEKLIQYIQEDGISHSLDMASKAKREFLQTFQSSILEPRDLFYKVMFPGPTGTNAVESALKLARKITGRTNVVSFTNGFHGMTLGSLAVTSNDFKRKGAGVPLSNATVMPYDRYVDEPVETQIKYIRRFLDTNGSGVDAPAALILETVQGEGGLNAASIEWLQEIEKVAKDIGALLIVDDIQAGVGRAGSFFSFEPAGIKPDIVCLSKSIGGYGLPLALTLFRPELDKWAPGEHNGTFRGNNLAFVTATAALDYWKDPAFEQGIKEKSAMITDFLSAMIEKYPALEGKLKGRGFIQGIRTDIPDLASKVAEMAFEEGLIMETAGPNDEVFKLFPPLTIDKEGLQNGLDKLDVAIEKALA